MIQNEAQDHSKCNLFCIGRVEMMSDRVVGMIGMSWHIDRLFIHFKWLKTTYFHFGTASLSKFEMNLHWQLMLQMKQVKVRKKERKRKGSLANCRRALKTKLQSKKESKSNLNWKNERRKVISKSISIHRFFGQKNVKENVNWFWLKKLNCKKKHVGLLFQIELTINHD